MNKQAPFTGMSNDDLEKKYSRKIDNIRTMLRKQGYSIPALRAKKMRTGL